MRRESMCLRRFQDATPTLSIITAFEFFTPFTPCCTLVTHPYHILALWNIALFYHIKQQPRIEISMRIKFRAFFHSHKHAKYTYHLSSGRELAQSRYP